VLQIEGVEIAEQRHADEATRRSNDASTSPIANTTASVIRGGFDECSIAQDALDANSLRLFQFLSTPFRPS
jgi:hypothetical protein